jgi:CheY-like chemotaxis protein
MVQPEPDNRAYRILIVDDDAAVRRVFAGVLRGDGYAVQTAGSAADALLEVASWKPHAILLDYRMPEITGVGFLYRLIADQALWRLRVAVITGVADLDRTLSDQLAELRIPVYFKPVGADDLLALTRRLVTPTIH